MPVRPEIFISAASRDLKSCRQLVRDALLTLGCVPIVQDHFPPAAGEVRAMLRERIAACHAVIHLAGECYGHEPRERDPTDPRRSYTQLEYDIARELKKPLYTFLCTPGFPYDAHDPELPELCQLQEAHRAALAAGDSLYLPIHDPRELSERVRELQTRVDFLARDLQKTRGWLGRGIAAAVAVLLLISGLFYGVKRQGEAGQRQAEARASQAEAQLAALQNQLQQQTRLISLVSEKLDRNAPAATGPGQGDPAAVAREETARQLGISVELLQKQLAGENTDVRALLARVEQASAAADTKAAEWRKLRVETLTKLGDAEMTVGHEDKAIEPYQEALALRDQNREPLAWCDAAQKLEAALWRMYHNAAAETLARQIVEKRTALQGGEHPDTLAGVHALVGVLLVKNDLAGAETLARHTLEVQEHTLGKEHPDTLASLLYLGYVLDMRHDQPGAEAIYRRCLEARERTLGKDHPDTLQTMNEVASSMVERGDWAGAEKLVRQCLEARERTLGKDHRATLASLEFLAVILDEQGDYAGAEPLFRRVMETRERVLGKDDPDTLKSLGDLSGFLYDKKDYQGAEEFGRRCLEAEERVFGKEDQMTLATASNLASCLEKEEKLPEAEFLYRRVLEVRERTLGKDDPDTLYSVNKLARLFDIKGDDAAAETFYLRAQTGMKHVLPPDDDSRLRMDDNLSHFRQKQGRLTEALALAESAVAGARKKYPAQDLDRLEYEKNLADLRAKLAALPSPSPRDTPAASQGLPPH